MARRGTALQRDPLGFNVARWRSAQLADVRRAAGWEARGQEAGRVDTFAHTRRFPKSSEGKWQRVVSRRSAPAGRAGYLTRTYAYIIRNTVVLVREG